MSLARAFTTRRLKRNDAHEDGSSPGRSGSMRKPGVAPINRMAISGPTLISTTNALSYDAPDIPSLRKVSALTTASSAASSSGDDSDVTSSSSMHETDASSVSSSSPTSPKPNHLSTYFTNATTTSQATPVPAVPRLSPRRSTSTSDLEPLSPVEETTVSAPSIPKRALSHSKSAHVNLARQRSVRSSSSSPRESIETRPSATSERPTSAEIFNVTSDSSHPFNSELQQLKEVAEELGEAIAEATNDEDSKYLAENNLAKFSAADYIAEIQPLVIFAFKHRQITAVQEGWI